MVKTLMHALSIKEVSSLSQSSVAENASISSNILDTSTSESVSSGNGPDSENPAHTSNDENHLESQQSISIDLPELINTSYVSDYFSNTHSPEKRVALEHPNEKSVSVGDTPPKIGAQNPHQ